MTLGGKGGVKRQVGVMPSTAGQEPATKRPKGWVGTSTGRTVGKTSGSGEEFAEVRFDSAEAAQLAVQQGNGSLLANTQITVELDPHSQDGTKILVTNLPAGIEWQEIKDHFSGAGIVQFAGITRKAHAATATGPTQSGEVRYESAADASVAMKSLNGSQIGGVGPQIWIQADPTSQDGTKLLVHSIAAGTRWQELKDHFQSVGPVAYAAVVPLAGHPQMFGMLPMPMQMHYGYAPMGMPPMMQQPRIPGKGMVVGKPVGEVRYEHPQHAQMAVAQLTGCSLQGSRISVQVDHSSMDGSKLLVFGIPPGCGWQELKSLAARIGPVAFVTIKQGSAEMVSQQKQGMPWGGMPMGLHGGHGGLRRTSGPKPEGPQQAEVRFESPALAQEAVLHLNGTELGGSKINVMVDPKSQDASKVILTNVPPTAGWQDIKDHCSQIGGVAFAAVIGPGEVRFEAEEHAKQAIEQLNGQVLEGYRIMVKADPGSQDGTKVIVENLPPGIKWQELKDYFTCVGPVSYAARTGMR